MIRMSALRNVPVVFGERRIGLFQSVCFDQTRKRVCAFVISCGMRGKRIVPAEHVSLISERFILIDGSQRYRNSDKQEMFLFIRDTAGILVGRVSDYALDEKSLEILALEMISGYSFKDRHKRTWIYAYEFSNDFGELSIPLDLCSRPYLFGEENSSCEYPP